MKILQGIIIGVGSLLSFQVFCYGLWNHNAIGFSSLIIATVTFFIFMILESQY